MLNRLLFAIIFLLGSTALLGGVSSLASLIAATVMTSVTVVIPATNVEPPSPPATILFVGDVMPSRYVAAKMRAYGDDYPFASTTDLLQSADLAFANLESPVTPGLPVPNNSMTFRSDPAALPALARAGIDIVSLANNHSPNYGEKGLIDTLLYLHDADIAAVGAGTANSAYAPVYYDLYNVKVAFIAQNDTDVVPPEYCAGEAHVGTACYDITRVANSIALAEKNADLVIFSMHSGTEYTHEPNGRQIALAHAAVDAGADLVIGHHPHVVQSAEVYKGKHIYYSLGNFIFDQNWSMDTRLGLIVIAHIDRATKKITDFEYKVVRIDDYSRPTPATEKETADVLKRLGL